MAVLVALPGCTALREKLQPKPPDVPYRPEEWSYEGSEGRKVTTPHYEIYSTLTDDYLLKTFPALMEACFAQYQKLVPPARQPQELMKVYLFAKRTEWERFTREFTGPRAKEFLPIRYGGYSAMGVTVIQYGAHHTTFPLMAHEGFHQYLHHYVNGAVPAWLNEGLAVVCEGMRWRGEHVERFDPWQNPLRRNTLAEAVAAGRTIPLAELLETNAGRVVNRGPRAIGIYYGQVWALVLFLQEGAHGKYTAGYRRLIAQLGAGDLRQFARAAAIWSDEDQPDVGTALFRNFIAEDLEAIEREYVAFMRKKVLDGR